ncbi:MAG: glycohydrolase toxin TNT-related protein [Selenomonadaceae bacterium]|nr:glycohydrolase toxin TNT-related protein [Selenomonadaceae bacterium]
MNLKIFNVALTATVIVFASPVFANSVISDEDLAKINSWGSNRPSDELYLQYKSVFDNPLYYNQETGAVNWPANDGFGETPYDQTLGVGTWIDRFGSDYGTFVCPAGIPYTMRSCAPGTEDKPYSVFVLKKSTDVQAGIISPWFDEEGNGYQYVLPTSVMNLISSGNLRRVEQWEFASDDHAQPAIIVQQRSMTGRILAEHLLNVGDNDVWIKFSRRVGNLSNDGDYNSNTVYGGYDRVRNENWRDGLFVTYGRTNYSSNTADAKIDDTRIGLYTSYTKDRDSAFVYLDYGRQKNNFERHVDEIYLDSNAKYNSHIIEFGGEYKHNLNDDNNAWLVSPYVDLTASYLKQSNYTEEITDIFGQNVDMKNNFYAALNPGIEFRRNLGNGNLAVRLGCEYAFTGTKPKFKFNYANYDRSVYELESRADKLHWTLGINGNFDISRDWKLGLDAAYQRSAHEDELSAAVQVQYTW